MKINCLSCGHKVDLGDAYGNYTGPVKCMVCGVILQIKTEEESVKAVSISMGSEVVSAEASETAR